MRASLMVASKASERRCVISPTSPFPRADKLSGSSVTSINAENFGTWVEFGGGFDVVDLGDGWSAFAKADFRYNDDLWGWTGQGGFRYDFQ